MAKIPHDDILEGLYKLRIRESEKLKTVLELYDLETHQKKLEPDYHRLQTMVKRSIELEIRKKFLGAEMEILRRTQWSRIREQNSVYKEFLEIVGRRVVGVVEELWRRHGMEMCVAAFLGSQKMHRSVTTTIL